MLIREGFLVLAGVRPATRRQLFIFIAKMSLHRLLPVHKIGTVESLAKLAGKPAGGRSRLGSHVEVGVKMEVYESALVLNLKKEAVERYIEENRLKAVISVHPFIPPGELNKWLAGRPCVKVCGTTEGAAALKEMAYRFWRRGCRVFSELGEELQYDLAYNNWGPVTEMPVFPKPEYHSRK